MNNFLRIKQGEKEELLDYLSRFKSERDILYRIFGKGFLDSYCELNPAYRTLLGGNRKKNIKRLPDT